MLDIGARGLVDGAELGLDVLELGRRTEDTDVREQQVEKRQRKVETAREREVLQLIAEGHTTKEIAGKLSISARTADVHRTHIMQKLSVHNVAGLTRVAIAYGLVNLPKAL